MFLLRLPTSVGNGGEVTVYNGGMGGGVDQVKSEHIFLFGLDNLLSHSIYKYLPDTKTGHTISR